MGQTLRPTDRELMVKLLDTLDTVLRKTKMYRFGCNISKEAVITSYNAINTGGKKL